MDKAEMTKEISKRGEVLLNSLNRGFINIPELKGFLSKLASLNTLPRRKKNEDEIAEVRMLLRKRK
jgi:hypothetical protein